MLLVDPEFNANSHSKKCFFSILEHEMALVRTEVVKTKIWIGKTDYYRIFTLLSAFLFVFTPLGV